ncbi:MAG: ABC transporter substrate-binding protein [Ruminococcus sp.]|nr:ABC transporter substrate-binding protein [Ruminococcus sp.]
MKRKIVKNMMLCTLSSMFLVTGCGNTEIKNSTNQGEKTQQVSETAVTFTDDLGREVTVDRPERVVVLTSSFADIWYLAGGVEQIVATTDATWRYFDLPLSEDVINLGSSKEINLEQLIACEPDFVLASCGTDRNVELESTLSEMGINTAYFDVDTFDDYLKMLKTCTEITGCVENYETYGMEVKMQVEQALERVDESHPSVLYVRATGSSCKVKNSEDSVLGEMLANMGCENIADRENSLLEQLSMEVILEEDPDYIFVVLQSADISEAEAILDSTLLSNPAWSSLTAVKEGRYYVMDSNLYNLKPNARWGEAYEQLAEILYPEK